MPRLPPHPSFESSGAQSLAVPPHSSGLNTLRMAENDIQETARFTREFVVMSLLPWMEKCVVEWNENVWFVYQDHTHARAALIL